MNDNNSDDPLPFIQLAAVVANVTRYLLREENEIADKQKRDANTRNAEHDSSEDKRGEVANRRIGKSPAGMGRGCHAFLPGSLLTGGGARRRTVSEGKLDYVVVSC